jgi:hypothetical protein
VSTGDELREVSRPIRVWNLPVDRLDKSKKRPIRHCRRRAAREVGIDIGKAFQHFVRGAIRLSAFIGAHGINGFEQGVQDVADLPENLGAGPPLCLNPDLHRIKQGAVDRKDVSLFLVAADRGMVAKIS